jgi:hypothetical protein
MSRFYRGPEPLIFVVGAGAFLLVLVAVLQAVAS